MKNVKRITEQGGINMTRIIITRTLVMLAVFLLFAVTTFAAEEVPIEEALSGLSGKVVDTAGKPVPEFTFVLQPMLEFDDHLVPADEFQDLPEGMEGPGKPPPISKIQTDSEGNFNVTELQPGFFQIDVHYHPMLDALDLFHPENLPKDGEMPPEMIEKLMQLENLEPAKKLISIQFGNVTFLNNTERHNFFGGITFALKPGVTIENVKITVKSRLRISGRIVYADGTPLKNAEVDLDMQHSDERGSETYGTDVFTDADGYFTTYQDEPGYYTLGAKYKHLTAGIGPFLINNKVKPEKLVLKLDGNKADIVKPRPPDNPLANEAEVHLARARLESQSVWIVNPANGHAYKIISCKDWHDAHQQAMREEAHLVAINDEAEQHWLEGIFEHVPFWWIGLTDVKKEGVWQWDGDEPVTYTNWTTFEMFPDRLPDTQKDYVLVTHRDGGWQAAGPGSPLWRIARHAVIEKDGLLSTIPAEAKNMDLDIDPTVESPFGFGPYPPIPDTWPADVEYWPCQSAQLELMQRVRIKLESEGKNISGMSMQKGLVYPNFPGTVYVEWAESGEYLSRFSGDPKTSMRLQAIIKAKREQGKPFTKEDVPDDIKLVPYDEGGIDPYQFLGLQRNDDPEEK